jgi:transcriptional regulator with XRE-family HTH domain
MRGFRPEGVRTYVLVVMAYPAYLRERARELRVTKKLSLDEIAERLALPKTTVYYWIKDLPLGRERNKSADQRRRSRAMQRKYRLLREAAYELGQKEWDELIKLPTFRDFVVLYIAEGYKRSRNTVSICNSDPDIVGLATTWLRSLSDHRPVVQVQYHPDQDATSLRDFWAVRLGLDGDAVQLYAKSNSGQLRTRVWRCKHGVAAVKVHDTYLRARLQAWMDCTHASWL